jgi:uncharacterized damage-inducible protein DinB
MDAKSVQALYEYNRWANARVFEAVSKLTEDQFAKDLGSSFASIRGTLTHIVWGEWCWLERWKGISPKSAWNPADFPGAKALERRWAEVERDQAKFVGALDRKQLDAVVSYVNLRGERWAYPLWQQMVHVVNHSTYHRGQVTTMLRQVGAKPVATDLLVFYDEKSAG